jgi:hypothetical protein
MSDPLPPSSEWLDDLIRRYKRLSLKHQFVFFPSKVIQVALAAAIPLVALLWTDAVQTRMITAAMGALIGVLEGIQQTFQSPRLFVRFRSTIMSLEEEKLLYVNKAGPYASARDPNAVLAERSVAIMASEDKQWVSLRERAGISEK